MLAWILESAGMRPGFLIGGLPRNFPRSARLGARPCFVVEADEYDSAFFDKRSKFVHYRPRTLIINNIEYDHADIFADLEAIRRQFHHLVRTVPGRGRLIVNGGDPEIRRVLDLGSWTPVSTFGADNGDWSGRALAADASRFEVQRMGEPVGVVSWPLSGRHNLENGLAAIAAAHEAGVDPAQSCAALCGFLGVARRLQHLGDPGGVHLYDDFAHHPTAIAATLAALRGRVGGSRILAVLEPRSNTMRMGVHREQLPAALAAADEVFLFRPKGLAWKAGGDPAGTARRWREFDSVEEIIQSVAATARAGDNVLIMSNGGFEGIQARLLAKLAA
jgi:UDP-N-acetylmuramate: L-alanyl-gamma-D-glutamyl-meso-diaminopimelate ligase